jgi:3-phosphoshikimate 1-carboxyvinyltransferase
MKYLVRASSLAGNIAVPPSKSHSTRAVLFASFANGQSILQNLLDSPDVDAMMHACQLLGAQFERVKNGVKVTGFDGKPSIAEDIINAGNSGQVLRFIGALASLIPAYTIISGDESIRHSRPVLPLLSGLQQLGCFAQSARLDGYAPIIVKGGITGHSLRIHGADSQPVSGFLMAAAFAPHPIQIKVDDVGEIPWIKLTLNWFDKLHIPYEVNDEFNHFKMFGGASYPGFDYHVPGDFSSAAFPMIAAVITKSECVIEALDMNDCQGDKAIVSLLQSLGVKVSLESNGLIRIDARQLCFSGFEIHINNMIDALPILTVLACFATSESEIRGAAIARCKESDRIHTIAVELSKMGAKIEEYDDGLKIYPSLLRGCEVNSHTDHRIAMALAVAGLAANGTTIIHGVNCVEKSFPNFESALKQLGANIEAKPDSNWL